jgi:uncharacterized protein YdcH (DUF465 family)
MENSNRSKWKEMENNDKKGGKNWMDNMKKRRINCGKKVIKIIKI